MTDQQPKPTSPEPKPTVSGPRGPFLNAASNAGASVLNAGSSIFDFVSNVMSSETLRKFGVACLMLGAIGAMDTKSLSWRNPVDGVECVGRGVKAVIGWFG